MLFRTLPCSLLLPNTPHIEETQWHAAFDNLPFYCYLFRADLVSSYCNTLYCRGSNISTMLPQQVLPPQPDISTLFSILTVLHVRLFSPLPTLPVPHRGVESKKLRCLPSLTDETLPLVILLLPLSTPALYALKVLSRRA